MVRPADIFMERVSLFCTVNLALHHHTNSQVRMSLEPLSSFLISNGSDQNAIGPATNPQSSTSAAAILVVFKNASTELIELGLCLCSLSPSSACHFEEY